MLESVHIQNFKGFKNTRIGPLRKVNLILGGQNVGKTSLLEAIDAVIAFDLVKASSAFRTVEDKDKQSILQQVFGKTFGSICADFEGGDSLVCNGAKNYRPDPAQFAAFGEFGSEVQRWRKKQPDAAQYNAIPTTLAIPLHIPSQFDQVARFSLVLISQKKQDLLDLLRKVEPRLSDLNIVVPDDQPQIYVGLLGEPVALPLSQLGHGFHRLTSLFCALLTTDAKLALIDEVENGIHYSALPTVIQGIKEVAQSAAVQTLMTTHSWDCIRASCEVFADSPQDFQGIRLERVGDDVRAVCIEGEHLLRMVAEDMEVR